MEFPAITVSAIVLTGITGAIISPIVLQSFPYIKNEVAMGIAIGTASSCYRYYKAIEMGETQGAMSGLCYRNCGTYHFIFGTNYN